MTPERKEIRVKKQRMYLACALRNAPHEFVENVMEFRERLERELPIEILRFIDLNTDPRPSHTDIFMWDMQQVNRADVVLVICDEPSFGSGFETAMALTWGKPVLMVAHEKRVISSFPEGINIHGAAFRRYTSWEHLLSIVRKHFAL